MFLIGKDLRYQYDAGAAKDTVLDDPTEALRLARSL
jgi:hypothetical protein